MVDSDTVFYSDGKHDVEIMFSFNFGSAESDIRKNTTVLAPSKELVLTQNLREVHSSQNYHTFVHNFDDFNVHMVTTDNLERNVQKYGKDLEAQNALANHSDLVSGCYEGGLKLWEGSVDLAKCIVRPEFKTLFNGARVLDLGCGQGLLGLVASKLGASSVHFQDYNDGVIECATMPNVVLNKVDHLTKFWCGDWAIFDSVNIQKYDVILTAETIYNADNYEKLHAVLNNKLDRQGSIFLAGKSYYFGVGGSVSLFEELLHNKDIFQFNSVWSSSTGVKREILRITRKDDMPQV